MSARIPEHEHWMRIALDEADQAAAAGEVPVGAVLVGAEGELARAGNAPRSTSDPTGHAEIRVLRAGAARRGNYRLVDTTLYVTVEPCTMCAGALVHARVATLVFGAREPKGGALVSRSGVIDGLNHRPEVVEGVLEVQCRRRMTDFFRQQRERGSGCSS